MLYIVKEESRVRGKRSGPNSDDVGKRHVAHNSQNDNTDGSCRVKRVGGTDQ